MKFARILSFSLAACLLAACGSDETLPVGGGDGEIVIALQSSGTPASRVSLAGSDPLQHVTYVQVYAFKGTGDDARCVVSENAMWHRQEGQIAAQYYKLRTRLDAGEYTFLAVGIDNPLTGDRLPDTSLRGAATAYGLPDAIEAGDGVTTGTRLADAYARLAAGKSADDIASAELMAGFAQAEWNRVDDITVALELRRRVAGVQCYLTNVPEGVTKIELICATPQYSNVPLCKQAEEADFGTEQLGEETEVLLSMPVNDEVLAAESVTLADGSTIAKQRGSVYAAAFLLPIPQQQAMLTLRLTNASGTEVKNVKLDTGEGAYTYDFPLRANWLYSIGHKSADIDEPEDLGGKMTDIVIDGNWQVDVDIPL